MTHLAVDLALGCTGIYDGDVFDTIKCPARLHGGERLDWWRRELRGWMVETETVVVEAPILYGGHTVGAINTLKLHGVVEQLVFDENMWYVPCQPTRLKKWWTGNGNASKEMMVTVAQERGYDVTDHNAADALALWHWYKTTGGQS